MRYAPRTLTLLALAGVSTSALAAIVADHYAEDITPVLSNSNWQIRHALFSGNTGDFNGDGHADAFFQFNHHTGWKHGVQYGGDAGLDPYDTEIDDYYNHHAVEALGVGDLDSDGYEDAVRVYGATSGVSTTANVARVVWGSAAGLDMTLSTATDYKPTDIAPSWTYIKDATSGDFNGDGHLELVLGGKEGAHWSTPGTVWVFNGGADGPSTTQSLRIRGYDQSGRTEFGSQQHQLSTGDFNGDGYDDLAVGSPVLSYSSSHPGYYQGAVYVYYGGAAGLDLNSVVKLRSPNPGQIDNFGSRITAGDLNGDGVDDVVASAPYDQHVTGCGYASVYYGVAGGVFTDGDQDALLPDCNTHGRFGTSLAISDMDGDGYNDLVMGRAGGILLGSADGVDLEDTLSVCGDGWGLSVADFDGDGQDDMLNNGGAQWLSGPNGLVDAGCDGVDVGSVVVDSDGDGVSDDMDQCPGEDATDWDTDEDGCIDDEDGDGVGDDVDFCVGDDSFGDTDGDGRCEDIDVCVGEDTTGDADADGICTGSDTCPLDADNDIDGDGVCGDVDICLGDDATGDSDGDQICDDNDTCEGNDASGDTDGDLFCDADDNCPVDANADQADEDGDAIGDVCEADTDGDGTIDDYDNCPLDVNTDQSDSDGDGAGDACDPDDDNDGVADIDDNCPLFGNADQADFDGDGAGDACDGDDDADGVSDEDDLCPSTPLDALFDDDGCSGEQRVDLECGAVDDHRNHGQYVSCVVQVANSAHKSGLVTNKESAAIKRAAAKNK